MLDKLTIWNNTLRVCGVYHPIYQFDGWMQKGLNFIANVMELFPVCMKPPFCKLFSKDPASHY